MHSSIMVRWVWANVFPFKHDVNIYSDNMVEHSEKPPHDNRLAFSYLFYVFRPFRLYTIRNGSRAVCFTLLLLSHSLACQFDVLKWRAKTIERINEWYACIAYDWTRKTLNTFIATRFVACSTRTSSQCMPIVVFPLALSHLVPDFSDMKFHCR